MNAPAPTVKNENPVTTVRERYQAPELRVLGDLRDLTLGGSPGTGDSGNAGAQQF